MEKKHSLKNIYERICKLLSVRNIALLSILLFILLMLPILYLSFVNRASGDDYGYAIHTRAAWMSTHSLIAVVKAALETIRQYYYGWQGTWFSIFVFSLQPEVFSDSAYVITVFVMLTLWIGSTFFMFHQILIKRLGFDKWSYILLTIIFLLVNIQFIPSTKSSIFWFNGCAHYMLPFAMCQAAVAWLLKYGAEYKTKYLVFICIMMTLLGGSNYQAALFVLIAAFYAGISNYADKKNKKIFRLFLPVILEMAGLIISMKAPGNKVRGGEEFGLSISKGFITIGLCFAEGIKKAVTYLKEKPLAFVGLFFLFLIMLEAFKKIHEEDGNTKKAAAVHSIRHPLIDGLALFCLYSAMQAPELYANVEVSGGVYNMDFQVCMLTFAGILLLLSDRINGKVKASAKTLHQWVVLPGLLFCLVLLAAGRSNIKTSTSWKSLIYITSGQAADYKEQMELQTELLTREDVQDVVLPFINDEQGPLMHMPVTDDKKAWSNTVTGGFYGKSSVVAMPRPEWNEKYGN